MIMKNKVNLHKMLSWINKLKKNSKDNVVYIAKFLKKYISMIVLKVFQVYYKQLQSLKLQARSQFLHPWIAIRLINQRVNLPIIILH